VPGGDLDGDGWDDLVVNSPGEMEAWPEWYDEGVGDVPFHARIVFGPFEGDVVLDEASTLDVAVATTQSSATYDLTGDGTTDVMLSGHVFPGPLVRGHASEEVAFASYAWDGDATRFGSLPQPVSDLDGDGLADLVVNDGVLQGPVPSGVYSASDVDWQFGIAPDVDLMADPGDSGDVDGDGLNDVAMRLWSGGDHYVVVAASVRHRDLSLPIYSVSGFDGQASGLPQRAFDFDADGSDDLLLTWSGLDGVSSVDVWYGPVAGTLEQGRGDATVVMPDGVWIGSAGWAGDHDGDGTEDLLIGWNLGEAASGAWLLLGGR
jgi:hypothetical protein